MFNLITSVSSFGSWWRQSPGEDYIQVPPSARPDALSMTLLHCIFALVFAALVVGVMMAAGFVVNSNSLCPLNEGYTRCGMWQDIRSLMSFVLGGVLCCCLTKGKEEEEQQALRAPEEPRKVQLYAYMI